MAARLIGKHHIYTSSGEFGSRHGAPTISAGSLHYLPAATTPAASTHAIGLPIAPIALTRNLAAYFPVMAERINHAPDAPAVFFAYGINFGGARRARLREGSIWICDR